MPEAPIEPPIICPVCHGIGDPLDCEGHTGPYAIQSGAPYFEPRSAPTQPFVGLWDDRGGYVVDH